MKASFVIGITALSLFVLSNLSCGRGAGFNGKPSIHLQHTIRINTDTITFKMQNPSSPGVADCDLTDVKLIRLKMKDSDDVIPGIEKISFFRGKIYCFDLTREGAVSIFDDNGSFIRKVSRKSRAVPLYKTLLDGRINEGTGNIELVGRNNNKEALFIQLDSSGGLIGSTQTKFPGVLNFYAAGSNYFFYKGFQDQAGAINTSHRLFSTRYFNLDIKDSYLSYSGKKRTEAAFSFECFSKLSTVAGGDTALFFENFNDTVYSISSNGLTPRNLVSLVSNKEKPEDFITDNGIKNKTEYLFRNKMPVLINYIENDRFVMILFSFVLHSSGSRSVENALFEKSSGKLLIFDNNRLPARMDSIPFLLDYETFPSLMSQEDGRFVSIIHPDYLLQRLKEEEMDGRAAGPIHGFCKKFGLTDLHTNQSPILLLYDLKMNK